MIKKILLMAGAAVAGIYLVSDEGKNARKALLKKKSLLEPVIKDLISQSNSVLDGTGELHSDQIRANIDLIVKDVRKTLLNLDLETVTTSIKEAIKVSARQLTSLENDVIKVKRAESKLKTAPVSAKEQIKTVARKVKKEAEKSAVKG